LRSGGKDVPQVSTFFLPLLVFLAVFLITLLQVSQHYITIVIVVHSVFPLDILDAEEWSLLTLSPLLDDPPIIRIFLFFIILLVLLDVASDSLSLAFTAAVVGVVGCG